MDLAYFIAPSQYSLHRSVGPIHQTAPRNILCAWKSSQYSFHLRTIHINPLKKRRTANLCGQSFGPGESETLTLGRSPLILKQWDFSQYSLRLSTISLSYGTFCFMILDSQLYRIFDPLFIALIGLELIPLLSLLQAFSIFFSPCLVRRTIHINLSSLRTGPEAQRILPIRTFFNQKA